MTDAAAMIDHTGIGVADVGRLAVYEAALGPLGIRRVMQKPENKGTAGLVSVDYPCALLMSCGDCTLRCNPQPAIGWQCPQIQDRHRQSPPEIPHC